MKAVLTLNAPQPGGHYAQAIVHGGLVYISGILPIEPRAAGKNASLPIEEQIRLVLDNLYSILIASGSEVNRVLRCTIYISDIALWAQVDNLYAKFFGAHRPARTVVPTKELHYGFKVELDAIAALNE